jgi:hypothetical protein
MRVDAASRGSLLRAGLRDDQLRRGHRTGALVRPVFGGYAPSPPDSATDPNSAYLYARDGEFRAAMAAALAVTHSSTALADRSAAYLLCQLWPNEPVPQLIVPPHVQPSRRAGVLARQSRLPPGDVVVIDGMRCTGPLRTALDLGRSTSRASALICLDAILHSGLVAQQNLVRAADAATGRGVVQLRTLARIADPGAESPGETLMRLPLIDAAVGPLETQVPVCNGTYRVDLVVDGCVLCEFEGRHHEQGPIASYDRLRFNDLAALPGTRLLRFDWHSVNSTHEVVARVEAALTEIRRTRSRAIRTSPAD